MRLRDVVTRSGFPRADATIQAQWREDFRSNQFLVTRAAGGCGHFAGDDIEQVVIGVTGSKTVLWLDMAEPGKDICTREMIGFGPQHQIAAAFGQAAVVHEQVAHLHVLGDPGIEHAESRQVLGHRVIPAQLAGIDQAREQACRHGLAVRGDLEQGLARDLLARTRFAFTGCARVNDLAVVDDADGETGQVIALHDFIEGMINAFVGRRGECRCPGKQDDRQKDSNLAHGLQFSCQAGVDTSPRHISARVWRCRTIAQRPFSTSTSVASGLEL